jgi:hypothetical protein
LELNEVKKNVPSLSLWVVIFLFACTGAKAKGSFSYALPIDFSIPGILSGPSVKKVFSGVYDLRFGLDVKTKSGFYFGPCIQHSLIKAGNSRNAFLSPYRTRFNMIGAGLSVGYELSNEGAAVWQFQFSGGYNQGLLSALPFDSALSVSQINPRFISLQPAITLRFKTVANTSFGVRMAYQYLLYRFDPYPYKFDKYVQFEPGDVKAYIGFFTFGFGFTYHFGNKEE